MSELVQILLAEDNAADVALMRRAFRDRAVSAHVHVVADGEAALRFLRREGEHRQAPRPDLVLLDINMPRMTGLEVLRAVKGDPDLRSIPVCMLTSSDNERDVHEAYDHHANAFLLKPLDFPDFAKVIQAIEDFWFTVVKLPTR